MPNQDVTEFLRSVFSDPNLDLGQYYKDSDFCLKLQAYVLEEVNLMVQEIARFKLETIFSPDATCIAKLVNAKNKCHDLSMLDFCIVAGQHDIALRLIKLGAKSTQRLETFKLKISKDFFSERPQIVAHIDNILTKITSDNESDAQRALLVKKAKYPMQKIKNIVAGEYKFPILLAALGILCWVPAALFFGPIAKAMLLVASLSLISSAVVLYSTIKDHKIYSKIVLESQIKFSGAKEIWGLSDLTKKLGSQLTEEISARRKLKHQDSSNSFTMEIDKDPFYLPSAAIKQNIVMPQPATTKTKKRTFFV